MFQFLFFFLGNCWSRFRGRGFCYWWSGWNFDGYTEYKKINICLISMIFYFFVLWKLGLISVVTERISRFKWKRQDSLLDRFLRFHLRSWNYIASAMRLYIILKYIISWRNMTFDVIFNILFTPYKFQKTIKK